ncbi:hypothetical protein BH09ACT12_BH09ACT12_32410 [soil metagenome]
MCRAVRCKTCGKTTWAGCGQHIAQVKASVPTGQWCRGGHSKAEKSAATARTAASNNDGGFFTKLFGRSSG